MTDRKYRQRGYQDSGSRAGSGFTPSSSDDRPQRMEGAPKGRGAERDRDEVFRCKACGERNPVEFPASATCAKCGAALHACVQCRHFDTSARNQCREPVPAPIAAKSRRNDCALYAPTISLDLKGKTSLETPDQARSAFDRLFGKK